MADEELHEGNKVIVVHKHEQLGQSDDGIARIHPGTCKQLNFSSNETKMARKKGNSVHKQDGMKTVTEVAVKIETKCSNRAVQVHNENLVLKRLYAHHGAMPGVPKLVAYRPAIEGDNRFMLVTEKCGPSAAIVSSTRSVPEHELYCIAFETLCVLHHLHSAGFVHRDIKPSNLLLPAHTRSFHRGPSSSSRGLRVIDFGISAPIDSASRSKAHRAQDFSCSLAYAPSGCLRKQPLAFADDLEALAYSLLELASGSLPWDDVRSAPKGRTALNSFARRRQEQAINAARALNTSFANSLVNYMHIVFDLSDPSSRQQMPPYDDLLALFDTKQTLDAASATRSLPKRLAKSLLYYTWAILILPFWMLYCMLRKVARYLRQPVKFKYASDAHTSSRSAKNADAPRLEVDEAARGESESEERSDASSVEEVSNECGNFVQRAGKHKRGHVSDMRISSGTQGSEESTSFMKQDKQQSKMKQKQTFQQDRSQQYVRRSLRLQRKEPEHAN